MQKLILSCLLICAGMIAIGQSDKPFPCGTPTVKDPWLSSFQKRLPVLEGRSDTLIYVPMTIHNVGKDDGSGFFRESAILDAFCRLNTDFQETNIQFYIKDTIIYHRRSDWYDHGSVLDGAFMMFDANVDGTLNTYIVANPAGNCGYNLPYAGIAMNTGCMGASDHTWAHEVGHAFSLPHPFLGWEGDVYSYRDETPTRVTYDYTFFKDSLILDTTIIDTAFVEFVERKNCLIAGDGFCDTPPDYLSRRWQCNTGDGSSVELQKDPDNVDFRSDGTLFMSYATDACSNRFSSDQKAAMLANIRERKPYLIDELTPEPVINDLPVLLLPEDGSTAGIDGAFFSWNEVENATGFVFQISRFPDFRFIQEEIVTHNTNLIVNGLRNGIRYYWRVRPFNSYDACKGYSNIRSFTASEMVSTTDFPGYGSWRVYPNPVNREDLIHIFFEHTGDHEELDVTLTDPLGKVVLSRKFFVQKGSNQATIELKEINYQGLFLLTLSNQLNQITFKVFAN